MEGDTRNTRSRSGNTFRKGGGWHKKGQQSKAVIVRHSSNLSRRQSPNEADDGHILADAVEFSLNKKGRWNLPSVIQDNILVNDFDDDFNETRVSMLHRHMVNRPSDCLRVITNDVQEDDEFRTHRRKKARRKTYCNGLNVLHNGRGKQTKDPRKKQVISTKADIAARKAAVDDDTARDSQGEEVDENVDPAPEVRYDVFYPVPASSSLRSHPKFAPNGHISGIEQSLKATGNVKYGKGSKKRYKHVEMDEAFFDDDSFCEEDYDDENDNEDDTCGMMECYDSFPSFPEEGSSSFATSLWEVLEEAVCVAASLQQRSDDLGGVLFGQAAGKSRRKRTSKKRERRCMYQPEQTVQSDFGIDFSMEDSRSDASSEMDSLDSSTQISLLDKLPTFKMPSVRVVLPEDAISGSTLSQQYGNSYSEAACIPRKFLIDITHRVLESLKRVESFRDVYLPSMDLSTCVVFSYLGEKMKGESQGAADHQGAVLSVALNMNYQDRCLAVKTLCDMSSYDAVEEVLRLVLEFICTLEHDKLIRKEVECPPCDLQNKMQPDFGTVKDVNGWEASFLSLSTLTSTAVFPTSQTSTEQQPTHAEEDMCTSSTPEPDYCGICFDSIDVTEGSSASPATALRSCGHWFCDACWQSHLSIKVRGSVTGGGGRGLQCPEYRCRSEIDVGTMLTLMHVQDVQLLQRRHLEMEMTGSRLAKWCPNPMCGRLIQLKADPKTSAAEPSSLTCTCSIRLCFTCLGPAHWPASCSEVKEYHALLTKRGDMRAELNDSTDLRVHGKSCPACGAFLEKNGGCNHMKCVCKYIFCWWCTRAYTSCVCGLTRHNDRYKTKLRVVKHVDTSPQEGSEWYNMAVQHRRMQHTREVKRKRKMADNLARRLLAFARKRPETVSSVDISTSSLQEVTTGILKLKIELHHVIEHTAAAMNLRQNLSATDASSSRAVSRKAKMPGRVTSTTSRKVKELVGRLDYLCTCLDVLLQAESARELRIVLPTFQKLQWDGRDILKVLRSL